MPLLSQLFSRYWFFAALALVASIPSLMLLAAGGWLGDSRFFNDATAFYCAGQLNLGGANPYDLAQQQTCAASYGRSFSAFFYPPLVLPLFSLWASLPYEAALIAWSALSILALGYVYYSLFVCYLREHLANMTGLQLGLLALWMSFSQIAFMNLPFGQVNIIAMACMMAAMQLALANRQGASGVVVTLVAALKFPFGLIGLMAVPVKSWRMIAGAFLTAAMLVGIIVVQRGAGVYGGWLRDSFDYSSYGGLLVKGYPAILERDNVSLFALIYRLIGYEPAVMAMIFAAPLLLVLAFVCLWRWRALPWDEYLRLAFAILPCFAYLLSSLTWQKYYVFLLPAVFWLFRQALQGSGRFAALPVALLLVAVHEASPFMPGGVTWASTVSVIIALLTVIGVQERRKA